MQAVVVRRPALTAGLVRATQGALPMGGIVQIVVIVLIVLLVLGYFGRGRFRA